MQLDYRHVRSPSQLSQLPLKAYLSTIWYIPCLTLRCETFPCYSQPRLPCANSLKPGGYNVDGILYAEVCVYIYIYGWLSNYGPFSDPYYNYYNTAPNVLGTQKRDHNFDNHPYVHPYPITRANSKETSLPQTYPATPTKALCTHKVQPVLKWACRGFHHFGGG